MIDPFFDTEKEIRKFKNTVERIKRNYCKFIKLYDYLKENEMSLKQEDKAELKNLVGELDEYFDRR